MIESMLGEQHAGQISLAQACRVRPENRCLPRCHTKRKRELRCYRIQPTGRTSSKQALPFCPYQAGSPLQLAMALISAATTSPGRLMEPRWGDDRELPMLVQSAQGGRPAAACRGHADGVSIQRLNSNVRQDYGLHNCFAPLNQKLSHARTGCQASSVWLDISSL